MEKSAFYVKENKKIIFLSSGNIKIRKDKDIIIIINLFFSFNLMLQRKSET